MSTRARPRGGAALVVGAALAMVACHDAGGRHAGSAPETAKETAMDDPLRSLDQHPGAAITIQQGTEHFRYGLITLVIRGGGAVEVDQLRSGAATHYAKPVPAARIAELGRTLAEHRLSAPRTTSLPRQPGDSPLVLRVEGLGAAPFQADLWYGDRYKDRDLDAIIRLADALVDEVSAGAVRQPAP
jgi:hypothetical protein